MRWNRLVYGLVLLVALGACGGKGKIPEPESIYLDGMQNSWLVGELLMGGQPSPDLLAQLAEQGFRTIVSTRSEKEMGWDEKAEVERLGMTFVRIPMYYPLRMITNDQVDALTHVMKYNEQPMMLHGSKGDRVAGLWGVWLAEEEGVEAHEAARLAEAAGMTRVKPQVLERLEHCRLLAEKKSPDAF